MIHRRLALCAIALAAIAGVSLLASSSSAALLRRADPPPPPASPSDAAPKAEAPKAAAPSCCEAAKKCCDPCIKYRHRRSRCCKVSCCETKPATLQVKDCCCCCAYDVPVCIPACCKGEPCVDSRCGIFGRTVVTYTWDCGYSVEVVLTKHDNILVTYFG